MTSCYAIPSCILTGCAGESLPVRVQLGETLVRIGLRPLKSLRKYGVGQDNGSPTSLPYATDGVGVISLVIAHKPTVPEIHVPCVVIRKGDLGNR